jgi:hypothetical protein
LARRLGRLARRLGPQLGLARRLGLGRLGPWMVRRLARRLGLARRLVGMAPQQLVGWA